MYRKDNNGDNDGNKDNDAINSVQNGDTGIKERHFNIQFVNLQFQKMSPRSWKQHLTELPSNYDGNINLNSFHEAFNSDLPIRDRIKNIIEDKDYAVACVDGVIFCC